MSVAQRDRAAPRRPGWDGCARGLRVRNRFLAVDVEKQPGVLLLDCDGGNPGACQSAVGTLSAHTKSAIVMFCGEMCEETIRCAIKHRVGGVILKSFSTDDVMAAMQYMLTGRTVMPAGWQRVVAAPLEQKISLSPRHRQILALIAQGMRNEEIASELKLSPNTIKFHIQALYLRLEVRNRVQAANQYAQITGDGGGSEDRDRRCSWGSRN